MEGSGRGPGRDGQAVGELLKRFSAQTRRLAQQEMELAKAELTVKAKAAGIAGGLFGAAGLFALLALFTLTAAAILALATAVAAWLAATIVTVAYLGVAAILGLLGRGRMAKAVPLAPTQALDSVKEDIAWLKNRAKYART
ncbi:MAG: phage holin family protein [Solirubrobacteraceae bacterium]